MGEARSKRLRGGCKTRTRELDPKALKPKALIRINGFSYAGLQRRGMIDHVLFMVDGKNPSPVHLHFHTVCLNYPSFVRHPRGIERYKFLFRGLAATQLETD